MMRLIFSTVLFTSLLTLSAFTSTIDSLVRFDKTEHDFGQIQQGEPQTAHFQITNLSDEPMILTKVKGSCGCTATAFSNEPIAPGQSTEIEATYNAKVIGAFTKTVTVTTNLEPDPITLKIKGTVQARQS